MKYGMTVSKTEFSAIIVYLCLSAAALSDSTILHIVGILALVVLLITSNMNESILLAVIFTPNLAIVTLSNTGSGLIGLVYLIVFLKCLVISKSKFKVRPMVVVPFVYLCLVSVMRVPYGNTYDVLVICEAFIVIYSWNYIFDNAGQDLYKQIYRAYSFGCVLMMIGMLFNSLADTSAAVSRKMAILDDANFTSMAYIILFACSLLAYSYKLEVEHPVINLVISLIGGAATGSRGFLVSLGVVVLVFVFAGVINKKERKATLLFGLIIVFVLILYFIGVGYIVELYNNTIGRTIDLINSYSSGQFMDVTSGRLFLWRHYGNNILSNPRILLFGRGFHNYYLVQNGGYYGMSAHNSYIASIIGVGLIGTVMLFTLYFSLWKGRLLIKHQKRIISFVSVFLGTAVGYFLLDGILDLRLVMSIVMTLVMYKIYQYELKNKCILAISRHNGSTDKQEMS